MARESEPRRDNIPPKVGVSPAGDMHKVTKEVSLGGGIKELTKWPVLEADTIPLSENLSILRKLLHEKRQQPQPPTKK